MKVLRKISKRKHTKPKKMSDNPLTNVCNRLKKKRSPSRAVKAKKPRYKKILITTLYMKMGKKRSTSQDKEVLEVEEQIIYDRYGDEPM
jgi:hypothetical protein